MEVEASTSRGHDGQRQSCDEINVHGMPSTTNIAKGVEKKVSSVKKIEKYVRITSR